MTTWQVGAVVVIPAALCALGAGAMSVIKGPPPALSSQAVLIPEAAGARAVGRLLWPPVMCVLGLIPVVAARNAELHGHPVVPAVASLDQLVAVLAIFGLAWVRYQEDAHLWWDSQVTEAKNVNGRSGTR